MAKDVKRALMIAKAEGGEVARGQRKRDAGFDPDRVLYHGTNKDIQAFTPKRAGKRETMGLKGTHLADNPEFANLYAEGRGANVMPVHARGNFLDAGKLVYEGSPEHEVLNELLKGQRNVRALWNTDHEGKRVAPPLHSYLDAVSPQKAERILRAKGYDGVTYPAKYGFNDGRVSARSNATVVFDPKNIRSQFAQFDPAHNDSDDISKAAGGSATKRALMIARDQRALLRRVANIYPGPGGGMDPSPGGGGYSGPGGGKYIGPSRYADGGKVEPTKIENTEHGPVYVNPSRAMLKAHFDKARERERRAMSQGDVPPLTQLAALRRGSNVYVWHGMEATHDDMAPLLGIDKLTTADRHRFTRGDAEAADYDAHKLTTRATGGRTGHNGGPALDEVPPFKLHSGAAKIIGAKGQKKATPQQYAAMPGIKPDELKHSKFDTLGSKALPREEVIKHLEDNALPLEETQLGGEGRNTATKFDGPKTTLPGGKNYREVLLHTPAAAASAGFRGRHWEEPDVFAHVRMSDRVGPNGEKILHLEESQSDWGQQGRDQGFERDPDDLRKAEKARDDYVAGLPARVRAELDRRIATARSEGREPNVEIAKQIAEDFDAKPRDAAQFLGETDKHNELLNAAMPSRKLHAEIPRGPYVDNTQKWTDLALKRVLHEAAHGGYDKIVVTPGDEQNKRYSLAAHVKELRLHDNSSGGIGRPSMEGPFTGGSLDAIGHDGTRHAEHVRDAAHLRELVGKDAAEKLLAQEPKSVSVAGLGMRQRALSGQDLMMGGAGMRGYYDNILPKRLQALAQQHDPQAKVNLFGHPLATGTEYSDAMQSDMLAYHELSPTDYQRNHTPQARDELHQMYMEHAAKTAGAELHSLDVTPQMRDSIKGNGFNSFKRGGEVEDPIKNWQWRPVDDVRNELQLDEIPSHVHKFGEFMDETARRAATQGLTPRDLIKAYAITRASIGRRALPVETLRSTFPELPKGVAGRVRPEGAMGHWLHTKMGQRYLDAAEAGRVDEEAIAHAQNSMRRFGKVETEPTALRWAAKNLPGREGRVSELIARAHRGQSSPEEWRGEMRVPGVAASKAGFLASMLGRGDQPTLDARQIILHTGRPTKEAAPILGRTGAADAAVNRLADRQSKLDFKHDKSMSPFYQHLAHHAIWDKTAGEETTHDDLMQALRGAKDGGRQGYASGGGDKPLSLIASHPVVQGLSMALPSEADLQQLLRKAGIVRPYNQPSQDDVEKALKIAQTYAMPLGVGSKDDPSAYYGVKQPIAARDVTTKASATKGFSLKPEKNMTWKEFADIGKGGYVVNLSGDRTRFGTLQEINGKPLNWPVKVYAGPDYIREPVKGRAWASAPGVISGLNRTVTDLSKKGPVFGMYSPYGGGGGDFAHHMFDAVMAQVNPDQISKGAKKQFDAAMKSANFIMGQTDKDKSKRERVKPRMEEWPGIDDPKAASEFARKKLTGDHRKAILEFLDKKSWTDEGFPHVGMTRVAVTDPKLMGVPQNVIGGNVALLKPSDKPLSSKHTSYAAGQPGEYVGTLPFAPRQYALPVSTAHFVQTPSAGKGVHVDPYSLNDKARGGYRTLFERNYVPEPVTQQMAEGAEEGIMKKPLYGLKTGGRAGYADGGGIDQLLQNLKGSFGQLNQQVAARPAPQAPANYQAMLGQATAPNDAYQRMMAQALNGKPYESLFPKASTPAAPTAPAPVAPITLDPPLFNPASPQTPNYSDMLQGGDGGSSGAADGGGGTGGAGAAGADGAGGDGGASSAGGGSAFRRGGGVQPTEAQKHAGNYQKRHLSFHGLPISIETPKGAAREGKSANGRTWRCTMPADYGYIKRTEGADGDHVDVYVGPDKASQMVFVINQNDHRTGQFDEHKAMLGYSSERAAVADYAKAFSDGKGHARIGSVEPMSLDAFKHWLKRGKTKTPAKSKSIVEHALALTRRK